MVMVDGIVPPKKVRSRTRTIIVVTALTLAALVGIAIINGVVGGTPSTKSKAASYITANRNDLFTVEGSLGTLEGQLRSDDVTGIANAAAAAQRILSNVANDLESYTGSWSDSTDATYVIDATQSLVSVTGAIVTWTNTPDEEGLAAQPTDAWQMDLLEWNTAVSAVWHVAHEKHPPTFS